jgi:hypothetical protein
LSRIFAAAVFLAPVASLANAIYTSTINSVGSHSVGYYPGLDLTIVQSDFNLAAGPDFPDLTLETGDLTLQLLAPAGSTIQILADVTRWIGQSSFFGGLASSSVSSPTVTVDFVNLIGGSPPVAMTGSSFQEAFLAPGSLNLVSLGAGDGGWFWPPCHGGRNPI